MVELLTSIGIAAATLIVGGVGGFATSRYTHSSDGASDTGSGLEQPAERLNVEPTTFAIDGGIETVTEAIDAVIDATDLDEEGVVDASDDPVPRARAVQRAAQRGELTEANSPTAAHSPDAHDDEPQPEQSDTTPPVLARAISSVQTRVGADTTDSQRLLDYLTSLEDTSEAQLSNTLESVIEAVNRQQTISTELADVKPHVDDAELARILERKADTIPGESGEALDIIATTLSTAVREREQTDSERDQLLVSAEQVCSAANEQTTLSFESSADASAWLTSLADRIDEGAVVFEDRTTSLRTVASQLELSPKSNLGREFLEVLMEDSPDPAACQDTLRSVVSTIDQAETTNHRLQGLNPGDVERLAGNLTEEFRATDGTATSILQERTANLESTVGQAGNSDLISVYAARQELRFYDRTFLPQLTESSTSESTGREDLDEMAHDIEQRRSTIRTEYPSQYPEHNHSIPIHFLELVSSLQEDADQARATGKQERAAGLLEAADCTLDWVAELYERHAYSVLLEQLRG